MPELPEVETVRLALVQNVVGKSLAKILHYRHDFVRFGVENIPAFSSGILHDVQRKGKFLCLHLSNHISMMVHLGMSGRLLIKPSTVEPETHTHIRIQIDEGEFELHLRDPRRFGFFAYFQPGELEHYPSWNTLGPNPFNVKPMQLYMMFQSAKRPVKTFLLDQKKIAGLGNIYVDESLHRSKLHPLTTTNTISQTEAKVLCHVIKKVLKEAIAAGGTSSNDYQHLDGTFGAFQNWLRVYQQEGKPCKTCGTIIQKIVLTGRGTHFCPACQL